MKNLRHLIILLIFGLISFSSLPSLHARVKGLQVSKIREKAVLELDNSRRIVLAGIDMPRESLRLLPALVAGRKIELEFEMDPSTRRENGVSAAYIFVDTQEIDIPVFTETKPRENRVMVNELLIYMGAARVREKDTFSYKDQFNEIQEKAKKEGQGIWSYSNPDSPEFFPST